MKNASFLIGRLDMTHARIWTGAVSFLIGGWIRLYGKVAAFIHNALAECAAVFGSGAGGHSHR